MSDDMIRVDDLRSQSIAEMNLIEQITRILDVIDKESLRVNDMMNSLLEGKLELVKKGYDYVRSLKEEAQRRKEDTMEYLVRVTPSLINKDIFMLSLNNLDSLTQLLDEIAYTMNVIASSNIKIDSALGKELQSMYNIIRSMIVSLLKSAKQLNIEPKKSLEFHEEILEKEEEHDLKYRHIVVKLLNDYHESIRDLMLLKDFVALLEETADKIRESSYDFRYLALYRG